MAEAAAASAAEAQPEGQEAEAETYYPIRMNEPEANALHPFPSNYARTTKYTILTFLPKNLFEQYHKLTNVYFLLIVVITLVPQISPMTPVTSILPVVFVLAVSAVREAAEDYKRYRSDKQVNNQVFEIMDNQGVIVVGDMLKLKNGQRVPADAVIIRTNNPDGTCYVETSQLDGETNLKQFQSAPKTAELPLEELQKLRATVVCELPNHQLSVFEGRITFDEGGGTISINQKQLLLQGARLRNTEYAYGVVVYTGIHTKLALNQRNPPSKFSRSDKVMNRFVLGVFLTKLAACIVSAGLASYYERHSDTHWYLWGDKPNTQPELIGVEKFFSYFALLSFIIPMSLMVTLEVARFIQALFMDWDDQMAIVSDEPSDKGEVFRMEAKTSNLNDELSLVKYVFSDKTGTLTENKMVFSACSISGIIYRSPMDGELADSIRRMRQTGDNPKQLFDVENYLYCMATCHTVVPEKRPESDEIEYQAQSPDEIALCKAARANGFVFVERTHKTLTVEALGERVVYQTLATMEFNSSRRRMSVLLRCSDGRVRLYTKGSDAVMLGLLADTPEVGAMKARISEDLVTFAKSGLRTLVLAYRDVPDEEFADWWARYDLATCAIGDRDQKVDAMHAEIEQNLIPIGCTAVEDKLQDGVPEAISTLLRAGIDVWVITGDKQETAINIGYSCKLITPESKLVIVTAKTVEECKTRLEEAIHKCDENGEDNALVINGFTTDMAVNNHAELFMELASKAHSVICCQVTPLQKAQIVGCVKSRTKDVCLSIGDGANDVSMIQTAHIGVGIFGREGTQAVRSSDYAIRQFRHLTRLLMVHGRYSMVRNSLLIKYSFYKNVAFFITQWWFAFFCRMSGQTIYDDYMITLFNIIFTFFPPLFIGLFEKDIPEQLIIDTPEVHRQATTGSFFNVRDLFIWLGFGLTHSLIFFFFAFALIWPSGGLISWQADPVSFWTMSAYINTYALFTVLTVLIVKTKYWTSWNFGAVIFSFCAYIIMLILESFIPNFGYLYWIIPKCWSQATYWLLVLLVVVTCVLPDVVVQFLRRQLWPAPWQIMLEKSRFHDATIPLKEMFV
eukprot:m51a1_g3812 putative probable phospholipid-transporting atpase id isoform x2 (1077) ;mRNA; r:257639-262020